MVAKKTPLFDLTVIVTAYNEGQLIYKTLSSINWARLFAEQRGLKIELIVILNRADKVTTNYVKRSAKKFRINRLLNRQFTSVGPARNLGAKLAKASIVSICDGDDLYSENWFYESYKLAKKNRKSIYHPEFMLAFGHNRYLYKLPNHTEVQLSDLIINHCWSSIITASRQLFLTTSYYSTPLDSGFGFEDWYFNLEAIVKGYSHNIVTGTIRFYRAEQPTAANESFIRHAAALPPSNFFLSEVYLTKNSALTRELSEPSRPKFRGPLKLLKILQKLFIKPVFNNLKIEHRNKITHVTIKLKQFFSHPLNEQEKSLVSQPVHKQLMTLPKSIRQEAGRQSEFEPQLWIYDFEHIEHRNYHKTNYPLAQLYAALINNWPINKKYTHILIAPRLALGGSEYVIIELVKILQSKFKAKILLVLTQPSSGEWLDRLPKRVDFVKIDKLLSNFSETVQRDALFRVLIQHQPNSITIFNDPVGRSIFNRYAKQLFKFSKLFTFDYLNWRDSGGFLRGYGREQLPNIQDYIEHVFTDNNTQTKYLTNYLGCANSKVVTLNTPVKTPTLVNKLFNHSSNSVLWAARLDKQKRLDILYNIALALGHYNFFVYGRPVLESDQQLIANLAKLPNVKLMGTYNNLNDLAVRQYCCFLHTADFEGIPVSLLQFMAAGLPIVCSVVGGVGEIINQKRGWPINKHEQITDYVEAIKEISNKPQKAAQKIIAAKKYVKENHSTNKVTEQLSLTPKFTDPKK